MLLFIVKPGRTTSATLGKYYVGWVVQVLLLNQRNVNLQWPSVLGHVVSNGEVRPEQPKLQAVKDFPTPITKKQVRAFLCLTGYYRKFIANNTEAAVALTDLTRKNSPSKVVWNPECEKAFQSLKEALGSASVLRSPDLIGDLYCKQMPLHRMPCGIL